MYQKILVPLDGSPLAEVVLPYVYKFASKFDAKVTLLHVCQPGESGIFMCEAYVKHLADQAEEQLKLKKGMLDSIVVVGVKDGRSDLWLVKVGTGVAIQIPLTEFWASTCAASSELSQATSGGWLPVRPNPWRTIS